MPAIASLEDLRAAQKEGLSIYAMLYLSSKAETTATEDALCCMKMASYWVEECVWSPHGKGSNHSKAGWGRHPGPKRMVFSAGVSCGLRSVPQNN